MPRSSIRSEALRMTVILTVLASVTIPAAVAQDDLQVLASADVPDRQAVDIEDLSWLAGRWVGRGFGGARVEEVWTLPVNGSMTGSFRLDRDDAPGFYEFFVLAPGDDGLLELRLKHFHPDLRGWETKDEFVRFPLLKVEGRQAFFDGLTFSRAAYGGGLQVAVSVTGPSGDAHVERLDFRRAGAVGVPRPETSARPEWDEVQVLDDPPSPRERAVYRAVLDHPTLRGWNDNGEEVAELVVVQHTLPNHEGGWTWLEVLARGTTDPPDWYTEAAPDPVAVLEFLGHVKRGEELPLTTLEATLPVRLVPPETALDFGTVDWSSTTWFWHKYPRCSGLVTLSRIGFSEDGDEAVLHVTRTPGGFGGEGHLVGLEHRDGRWVVTWFEQTWIS